MDAYFYPFRFEMMAEEAGCAEEVEHVNHEKRVEDGCGKFYMAKVAGTRIVTCMTGLAPIEDRFYSATSRV